MVEQLRRCRHVGESCDVDERSGGKGDKRAAGGDKAPSASIPAWQPIIISHAIKASLAYKLYRNLARAARLERRGMRGHGAGASKAENREIIDEHAEAPIAIVTWPKSIND